MITALSFATKHGSFWRAAFPALENYIRVVNSGAYDRVLTELKWEVAPSRAYIVSEVSVCLYKNEQTSCYKIEDAFIEAGFRLRELSTIPTPIAPLDEIEAAAATKLACRIKRMVADIGAPEARVLFDPAFRGCGALLQSHGDLLSGATIVELKSVDRGFRASDFRQIITYVFQNAVSQQYRLDRICLLNARHGIMHVASIPQFFYDTAGVDMSEAEQRFLAAVAMGGASR